MSQTVVTPFISKCAYMFCAAIAPTVAKSMFSPVEKRPSGPPAWDAGACR
jgi:hypothetical protein